MSADPVTEVSAQTNAVPIQLLVRDSDGTAKEVHVAQKTPPMIETTGSPV